MWHGITRCTTTGDEQDNNPKLDLTLTLFLLRARSKGRTHKVSSRVKQSPPAALRSLFGPPPSFRVSLLPGLWRRFEKMEKAAWNVHWLQLGGVETIWKRDEQEVRGIRSGMAWISRNTPSVRILVIPPVLAVTRNITFTQLHDKDLVCV